MVSSSLIYCPQNPYTVDHLQPVGFAALSHPELVDPSLIYVTEEIRGSIIDLCCGGQCHLTTFEDCESALAEKDKKDAFVTDQFDPSKCVVNV
jgi:hypothetical protein